MMMIFPVIERGRVKMILSDAVGSRLPPSGDSHPASDNFLTSSQSSGDSHPAESGSYVQKTSARWLNNLSIANDQETATDASGARRSIDPEAAAALPSLVVTTEQRRSTSCCC